LTAELEDDETNGVTDFYKDRPPKRKALWGPFFFFKKKEDSPKREKGRQFCLSLPRMPENFSKRGQSRLKRPPEPQGQKILQ
jgi:hypothetical protein